MERMIRNFYFFFHLSYLFMLHLVMVMGHARDPPENTKVDSLLHNAVMMFFFAE